MTDQKTVDLLIQAKLKGGRNLESITKSVRDLEEAIGAQAAAARKGESAYDGLKAAADGLKAVQDELGGRSDLVNRLRTVNDKIREQADVVEKATAKLAAYEKKVGDDRSDKQQARVQALTKSLQAQQSRLDSLRTSAEQYAKALADVGVDSNDLVRAQRDIADAQTKAAAQQARVNDELTNYTKNVNAAKAAAQDLARAQTNLAKLQTGNAADARLGRQQAVSREQAEFDQRARYEAFRKSDAQQGQRASADSELAAIRESEEFMRRYAESKAKAAAQDAGLKKAADDAERTSRAYSTLTRASQDLRPRVVSLRDAIDGILNPAAKARETLAGVESEIQAVATTIGASDGKVKDLADQFKNLAAAQKAIQAKAGLIDNFQNQIQALREQRAEFVAARAQVAQYVAEMRKGGDAAAQFTKPLAEAQIRLRQAAVAMRDQVTATRQSREALRQAGIDSNNLAGAQQRLVAATQTATQAMNSLRPAVEANGAAAERAGKGFSLFRDEGRTTLSIAQRIRGEVLALTTAYIGVNGAINLAAGSLKAYSQAEGLKSTLTFALGDNPQLVAKEIAFIREEAERLGISFEAASKGYAKFAAAAVKSGAPVEESREIFSAFSEVARVIRLTPDELNGLFNAIGQSFSKGKIQAEELRQQIGERLPGAFAFAQQALKDKFPDLNKALEEGKVGVENMLLIARSVQAAAQGGLKTAIASMDAEQQRFNNSVLFFKEQIANAGFADAYVNLLKQLSEFFRSDDGKKFAQNIGQFTAELVNGITYLGKFREEIGTIALTLTGMLASGVIVKIAAGIAGIGKGLSTAGGIATAAIPIFAKLAAVISAVGLAVGVGLAAYSFADYLRDQSQDVRIFGIALVTGFAELFSRIKFSAMELWEDMPRLAENGLKATVNKATELFRKLLLIFQVGAKALGLDSLGSGIAAAIDTLTLKYNTGVSSRVAAIRREAAADLARIKAIGEDMLADEVGRPGATTSKRDASDSRFYRDRPVSVRASTLPPDPAEAKKRATEIDRIRKALEQLDAKGLKKQGETLQSLLDAIDLEYADLGRDIAKLGGEAGKEFAEFFALGVSNLKLEVTRDFNDKILKEQESLQSKLDQIEVAAGKKQKDDLAARQAAVRQSYDGFFRELDTLQGKAQGNAGAQAFITEARRRAESAITELQNLERVKMLKEELERREKSINDLLQARELSIRSIEAQYKAGNITRSDADSQILAVIKSIQPEIEKSADSARDFATANAAAFDPNRLAEFLAKLQEARNSGAAVATEFDRIGTIVNNGIGQGVSAAFDSLYDSIGRLSQGTADWGDVIEGVGKSILQTFAQILKEIATLILKQQVLNALRAAGFISGAVAHSGAVIGVSSPSRTRSVSPALFANAPRYHTGGVVGIAPDEYPAILQKNEEVLSASDPRNIMNANKKGAGGSQSGGGVRVVLVDDRSRVADAMSGSEGESVVVQHIRANIPTIRQWMK